MWWVVRWGHPTATKSPFLSSLFSFLPQALSKPSSLLRTRTRSKVSAQTVQARWQRFNLDRLDPRFTISLLAHASSASHSSNDVEIVMHARVMDLREVRASYTIDAMSVTPSSDTSLYFAPMSFSWRMVCVRVQQGQSIEKQQSNAPA